MLRAHTHPGVGAAAGQSRADSLLFPGLARLEFVRRRPILEPDKGQNPLAIVHQPHPQTLREPARYAPIDLPFKPTRTLAVARQANPLEGLANGVLGESLQVLGKKGTIARVPLRRGGNLRLGIYGAQWVTTCHPAAQEHPGNKPPDFRVSNPSIHDGKHPGQVPWGTSENTLSPLPLEHSTAASR